MELEPLCIDDKEGINKQRNYVVNVLYDCMVQSSVSAIYGKRGLRPKKGPHENEWSRIIYIYFKKKKEGL